VTILSETGRRRLPLAGQYRAVHCDDQLPSSASGVEEITVRAGDLPDLKARSGELALVASRNWLIFHVIEVDGIVAVCWAGNETLIFDEDEPVDVLVRW
jgi:hypothetical protein